MLVFMQTEEGVSEVLMHILQVSYAEAEPGTDFGEEYSKEEDMHPDFYEFHYLPHERLKEIFDEVCSKYDLSESERSSLSTEVMLGAAPSGNRGRVERKRIEEGLPSIEEAMNKHGEDN